MAKAVARSSRGRRKSARGSAAEETRSRASRVAGEFVGFVLLATAALTVLALATYSASDPLFSLRSVDNAAGPVGATLAGLLMRAVGVASVVAVLALGWLGTRLLLNLGMPSIASRFWVGSAALLASLTSLPLVLHTIAPDHFATIPGGLLGQNLVVYEQLLFSTWGALLVNLLILTLGILCVLGIPIGSAIWAVGAGATVAGEFTRRGLEAAARGARLTGQAAVRAGHSGIRQLHAGATAARLWRERRARRARRLAPSGPAIAMPGSRSPDSEADPVAVARAQPERPVGAGAPAQNHTLGG